MRTLFLTAAAALALGGAAHAAPMPEFPAIDDASFTEPSGDRVLALSTVVDAPVADVWRAFSTEEGWKSFAVKMAKVDFRQGGVIETSYDASAQPGQPGNIRNLILAIVPEHWLVIRNIQAPPGFEHAEEFGRTVTAIELSRDVGRGTRVRIWATGYRPEPSFRELFAKFRMGDAWTLEELRKRFAATPSAETPDLARARFSQPLPDVRDTSVTDPAGPRMIEQSVEVKAPVATLWKAFTDTQTYRSWGAPMAEITPGIGGHMEVVLDPKRKLGDPANLRHEILAYAPERLLVFRNVQAPPGLPGGEVYGETRIVLEFQPVDTGWTRVILRQTGYGQGAAYDALWGFFRPHNAEMLESLKTHFETAG